MGTTSAVGCYPPNAFGLSDMSGNVFEWTRSLWGKEVGEPEFTYPYRQGDESREDLSAGNDVCRVVRGGSWVSGRVLARCARRGRLLPDYRYYLLGVRVVLVSPPV